MKQLFLLLFFAAAAVAMVRGQSNYAQTNFRVSETTWTDISASGTPIAMTNAEAGVSASPVDIGFTFQFNGTSFTQCMIHADGILRFGTGAPGAATDIAASPASSYSSVFTSTATGFQNVILPFFTNLVQGTNPPQFHVLTEGAAPNRVCTIQWKNLRDADNPGSTGQHQYANLEFQVKLYETTNDIEMVYGNFVPAATALLGRFAASGIKAGSTSFLALARINSAQVFQKVMVLNPTHFARIAANTAFRNNNIPVTGFSQRFFGRIASDVNAVKIYTDSIITGGVQANGVYEALVVNEGTAAASNIEVTLQITGANTANSSVNVATLAAGASQVITFSGITLANKGQQQVRVTVNSTGDARADNNMLTLRQVVSTSHNQSFDFSTTGTLGVGFNNQSGNISAIKIFGTGTRKIKQVRIPFGSYRNIVNVRIYEDGGAGGAPSSAPLFTSANMFTTSEHFLIVPLGDGVTVTGDYYVAVQQTSAANMVWRVMLNPPRRNTRHFTGTAFGSWATDNTAPPWENMAEVYEENTLPDVGIERVSAPGCDYSTNADVKVVLRNYSAAPVDYSATPVQINGEIKHPSGTNFPISVLRNSGILAAGGTEEITVKTGYDFSARGFHFINSKAVLAGDAEAGNDSLQFFINNSIPLSSSAVGPVCPLTPVTITGVGYLANPLFTVDGLNFSATTHNFSPLKTTVVKFSGQDYRGCTLVDSIIVQVTNDGLPPRPVMLYGDTILSHRRAFRDTVRVQKLAGHTIEWQGLFGTVSADSAFLVNQIVAVDAQKVAVAYRRTADGCANLSDTLTYRYIAGVLHNENTPLAVCDTAFYDTGGPLLNTGNNMTRTFTPATPGTKMRLTFYRLELANFAGIQVFDGPNTSSPRIEALSPAQNGNTTREFIASNESGVLTVQFSVGSGTGQGWWAGLTCHTPEVYRTIADGNWITAANWERRAPGGNFVPASRAPMKGDDTVYVRHLITLINSTPMDQVVVTPSGSLNFENPGINFISMPSYRTVAQPEFLVQGTLNISQRVQIFGEGGRMIVEGRLNNFGKIDLDSVTFSGIVPQTLGNFSGASGTMKILKLDNPAGLTMGSDQSVAGIRFVRGMLNTSSENLLTLTEGEGFVQGARDEAHVNGPVAVALQGGLGSRLFPIGSQGRYRPVLLENSSVSGESSNDILTAEVRLGAPPNRTLPPTVNRVSELRYYRITLSGSGNSQDYKVTLPYLDDDGVTDSDNLTIVKDNGAGEWLDIGGTPSGTGIPGTLQSNLFNGFSDFALANKTGGSNPLPVTWTGFTAKRQQADALLEWQTQHEQRCMSYDVERSRTGEHFAAIGNVSCRNSSAPQAYQFTDAAPGKGTFYYRLKQVDTDGRFTYSAVRAVSFGEDNRVQVFPNPATTTVWLQQVPGNSDVRLYDASGRLVLQQRKAQPAAQLQVSHLPSGLYRLVITTITGTQHVQVIQIIK